MIELGETGLDGVVKDAMAALPGGDMRNLGSHYIQPALEYLRKTDPAWASEWVAIQIAEGVLYGHEYWLPFATAIPDGLVEKYLQRLETEDFKNRHFGGMIAVIAARADAKLAARVFAKLRELRRKVDAEPGVRHEFEWQVMNQLEAVFRRLPDDVAAAGILSSVTSGDPLDIKVAADLLSRVARSDVEPLRIADDDLKARLRAYLKSSVDLVLRQDDFNGEEKANLASSIAQVGKPEDMADLVLGFVDPDIRGIALTRRPHREDVLVARLTELLRRRPEATARLRELCERDLPELNRHVLSRVMDWLGTPEALAANLNLIDDAKPSPVPQGIWDQLETAFVERRPYGQSPNVFTEHARASNELRVRLFRMAIEDEKRRKSAFMLLGQIEEWRLEHGRPTGEPRHPNLASGQSWPPKEPFLVPEGSSVPDRTQS